MTRAFAVISVIGFALPVHADTEMTAQNCLSGWQSFNLMISSPPRLRAIQPEVTDDGWCRINRSIADLRANDFDQVLWRADGVEDAVENKGFPLSFEARFTGIDLIEAFGMPLPESERGAMGALTLAAERMPDTRDFEVEELAFDFGELGRADFTLDGGGIDLSSLSQMQLSLGGLRLNGAELTLVTTKTLSAALFPAFGAEELDGELSAAIGLVPDATLDDQSRGALKAFIEAGAEAEGQLDMTLTTPTGLGFLQVVGGMMSLEDGADSPEDLAAALEQILTGVTLSATWTPEG